MTEGWKSRSVKKLLSGQTVKLTYHGMSREIESITWDSQIEQYRVKFKEDKVSEKFYPTEKIFIQTQTEE